MQPPFRWYHIAHILHDGPHIPYHSHRDRDHDHAHGRGRDHGLVHAHDRDGARKSWSHLLRMPGRYKHVSFSETSIKYKEFHIRGWGSWRSWSWGSWSLCERILVNLRDLPRALLGLRVVPVFAPSFCCVFFPRLIGKGTLEKPESNVSLIQRCVLDCEWEQTSTGVISSAGFAHCVAFVWTL